MPPPFLSSWHRIPQALPLGARRFVFALAAVTALVLPFTAFATPVTYKFDADAMLTETSPILGDPKPVTGSFTVDVASSKESDVTIVWGLEQFGPTFDTLLAGPQVIHACNAPGDCNMAMPLFPFTVFSLSFDATLDGSGPVHLASFLIENAMTETLLFSGSGSGTASPVPTIATPEPTSLALIVAALGIFLLASPGKFERHQEKA